MAQAEPRALAVAQPEDARRQALERDALAAPGGSSGTAAASSREHLEREPVGRARCPRDRPRAPPSGTAPCLRRTAAGCTRARSPGCRTRRSTPASTRLRADVVAVVERDGAAALQCRASRRTCAAIAAMAARRCTRRGRRAAASRASARLMPVRHVAVQRVVRRGLVGDDVGHDAAGDQRGQHVGGVGVQRHRTRACRSRCHRRTRAERLVEVVRRLVHVARGQPPLDALAGRPRRRAPRRRSS